MTKPLPSPVPVLVVTMISATEGLSTCAARTESKLPWLLGPGATAWPGVWLGLGWRGVGVEPGSGLAVGLLTAGEPVSGLEEEQALAASARAMARMVAGTVTPRLIRRCSSSRCD